MVELGISFEQERHYTYVSQSTSSILCLSSSSPSPSRVGISVSISSIPENNMHYKTLVLIHKSSAQSKDGLLFTHNLDTSVLVRKLIRENKRLMYLLK